MPAVSLYAALLAILYAGLSVRTLRLRRRLRIAIGDSGDERMQRAMRAHANFAEYVPLTLLLIYLVEIAPAHAMLIHALGLALLLGRALHAWGISRSPEDFRFRVAGMALTLGPLLVASLYLLLGHASVALAPVAGRA